MNIKTKLLFGIGILAGMIILLVTLSVVNLQLLTATEPDSPAAMPALERALLWISVTGGICVLTGLVLLFWLPRSISKPILELKQGILEIANHNYEKRLDMKSSEEFREVADSFNRMAERLTEYRASTLADILSAKKFLEAIVNSINEPIIGLNTEREILFINNEALNVLNLKRENVIRRSAEELSLKNDLLRRLIRELVSPGDKKEPLKIYADNKESYFKAAYIPINNTNADKDEPHKLGDVILLKNITEFKELDSAKTTFISTISHELKTPISAIMMSLQLLEDKRVGTLNEEQEQLSKSIKDSSQRLLEITGELLNMTQVEAGKLQMMPKITKPIELIEYAIKANQVQADKFNIQIEVEYPEEKIGKLFVDSEKIAWVLTNLLSNAIRYSRENGRVVIGAQQEGDQIELYVQDFGKGIDPRYHQSIFDRYFRVPGTKVQGSGLGLSISKDFVEAHGGTLTVESELGKGSRFVIRLRA
ncbi:HAMP domain-containing sensor histidine kinase [Bacteroides nordii]|uniref:HAMP domain-containing sensor histidine kinase n=1 Tax=Bacteroides nordii TaxID=291645 RepID=UPI00203A8E8D|nr:ATP-binding protein [Bacteroides nordii]GFZ39295.1 histidine kinase [Bacteroides nordii]